MQLTVSEEIFEKFPDTRIGIVVATGMDNSGSDNSIKGMLESTQLETENRFEIEKLAEHPSVAVWRAVYSNFGSKPRDFRSSVEALIRSVLNGRGVRHINKLVDIYNYASLKHAIPVGGEDLDKTHGNLFLKFSEGTERFIPLGGGKEDNPYKGEVIYCDEGGNVLCRRWNWRESDITKLTESTRNAIIVAEGFDTKVDEATEELSVMIRDFCNAQTKTFLINKNNPIVKW